MQPSNALPLLSPTPTMWATRPAQQELLDFLRQKHRDLAHKTALVEDRNTLTYEQLWARVDTFAAHLEGQGVKRGHVVGIMCPMAALDVATLVLAVMQAGGVPLVINLTDKFQRVDPHEIGAFGFVMHARIRSTFGQQHDLSQSSDFLNGLCWYQLQAEQEGRRINAAALVTSSGSTGGKKIIQYTQKGMLENVIRNVEALDIRPDDRTLMVLPLTYSYGLVAQFFSHLYAGASIVFTNKVLFAGSMVRLIEEHRITSVFTVPPIFRQLVFSIASKPALRDQPERWESLRYVTVGGNHIEPSSILKGIKLFGRPVVKTYGLAEAGPRVATNHVTSYNDPVEAVGYPLRDVQIRILSRWGTSLAAKKIGRVEVTTPSAAAGYFLGEENSLKIRSNTILTQDLGYLDEAGRLFILGRKSSRMRVSRFGRVLWHRELIDALYTRFNVFKVGISVRLGRIVVSITPLARQRPEVEDIRLHIEQCFGAKVSRRIDVVFPRLNRAKFQK